MCGTTTVVLPKNGPKPRLVFPREIRTNLASKCTSHQLATKFQAVSDINHVYKCSILHVKARRYRCSRPPLSLCEYHGVDRGLFCQVFSLDAQHVFFGLSAMGEYADLKSYRQNDGGVKAPIECHDEEIPLFEDEDSAAWASVSLNVAIARKSLSSVQVCVMKSLVSCRLRRLAS